ncbi:phosphatase PAP2 family protein [Patulibacter sp. SYSU D01012]|uniref:phosphatase PAP2 family protein n=1 Tax=Patulibacter sp. SYSU D01012 TaxID=2817381 RepID=UPI0032C19774
MAYGKAIRAAAWSAVALGAAAPLVRRRLRVRPSAVVAAAAGAPVALTFVMPRSRVRDVAVCTLQMWAYFAAYEIPADDPDRLRSRVRIDYPVRSDTVIGGGRIPTVRLQQALHRDGRFAWWEKVLSWSHWVWFAVPHTAAAYVLLRRPEQFPRAAARIYATFDLGAVVYWAVPTAPPWFAAEAGRIDFGDGPPLRRLMREYGEGLWGDRWPQLYDALGGNPLAAMPSLHFGTSVAAAQVLRDTGPVAGAVGWTYALTLGFALVYLGEHYVTDLVAGASLAEGVRRATPHVSGPLARVSDAIGRHAARARAAHARERLRRAPAGTP